MVLAVLVAGCYCGFALNPSLDVSQYAHTAWTIRDGFSLGNIYAMAQTPDGYLWLGGEFGLFRFDGVRSIPWKPPAGQNLPDKNINSLLVSRDGTLWIGTFSGLATWSGGKLVLRPELGPQFIASLFEDHEGTVWAGTLETSGRLCAIRRGSAQCYGEDGAFGKAVWALHEDSSGNIWAAAQSGLWRMKPGPPRRYPTETELIGLNKADDGRLLIAIHGGGLLQLGKKIESYPIRSAINTSRLLPERDVDSNRLLRDRDGGLWIGTVERGLIHLHHGRTDIFTRADGLSGDVILSLFEDREGNIWVSSTGGLDRFRELPVATVSVKQGLSSDASQSLLAATDGSIWVGAHYGLSRWKNGQTTIYGKASGLPDDAPQSLFQDDRGRIWVYTGHGLAYFQGSRFVAVNAVHAEQVHFIAGDKAGNLWLSAEKGLLHLLEGRLIEQIPWSELGRHDCCAEVLLSGREPGGLWLGYWTHDGVSYFKDRRLRASYTAANGLGRGEIADLQLDRDGALWVATQRGGLSRLKDGRIATLTSSNGLPCDTIHWTMEDDDRAFWLYTACGLVRITRTELDAWVADPKHRVQTKVWDAADGVRLRSSATSAYGPRIAKSTDGKLWYVTGEGIQVVDPRHLAANKLPPPVHIEQVRANGKTHQLKQGMRLPANVRDVWIDYTALSLAAPEKIHFKYKLEGQDRDWREVVNDRRAQYTNLPPRHYRFRVIASNNSGVWNEQGDTLEFSVDPAYYQTNWFRALSVAAVLAMIWGLYRLRLYQISREFNAQLDGRVDERTRVARDLHDTLLQSFQGLIPVFQTARNLLPGQSDRAAEVLDEGLHDAADAIVEGRNAIQNLRATPSLDPDLGTLLNAAGQELAQSPEAEGSAPAFRVVVEGPRLPLVPLLRDEIYRIGREVLRNAFRHAHAGRIEAEIRYDRDTFRLRIRDDGKGIDSSVLKHGARSGHFGLPGMHERAKRMGGRLNIWSELGAGTEAELTVPARIAYEKSARLGRRLRLTPPKEKGGRGSTPEPDESR